MTWEGYWAPALVNLLLLVPAGVVIRALVLRALRRNREQLERALQLAGLGVPRTGAIPVRLPSPRHEGAAVDLRRYRKAIATGIGVTLTGLLTWATSDGGSVLEHALAPLVAEPWRPVVGFVVGGLVTVAAVVKAENAPKPGPRRSIVEPAPPVIAAAAAVPEPAGTAPTSAGDATPPGPEPETAPADADPVYQSAPFWADVKPGAPTSPTALVRLQPVPESSPL